MKKRVQLWKRPTYDGSRYTFYLLYTDEQGRRRQKALGHADARKAERQRQAFERELRMGHSASNIQRLNEFLEDSLRRTGKQIRESTQRDYRMVMQDFIGEVGNMDYRSVEYRHGEFYVQKCLDRGNTRDTVAKKVRTLKRFFNLALERGQIDENPLRFLKQPRRVRKKIRTLSSDESHRLIKAARDWPDRTGLRWDMLVILALTTGMRKSELLNLVWSDIDFDKQTVLVTSKADTGSTWRWEIKDADERLLPLTDGVLALLTEYQATRPEGCPYVFLPGATYENIQKKRRKGQWTLTNTRLDIAGSFSRRFKELVKRAAFQKDATFHDLRRTALSDWLQSGMSILDVMRLAGHASIDTTQKFYLEISEDMVNRARASKALQIDENLLQICCKSNPAKNTGDLVPCNPPSNKNLEMGRGGFEPPTHGFSVRCSTN